MSGRSGERPKVDAIASQYPRAIPVQQCLSGCSHQRRQYHPAHFQYRWFETYGRWCLPASASVCLIPCLILCLAYVGQKRMPRRTVRTSRQRVGPVFRSATRGVPAASRHPERGRPAEHRSPAASQQQAGLRAATVRAPLPRAGGRGVLVPFANAQAIADNVIRFLRGPQSSASCTAWPSRSAGTSRRSCPPPSSRISYLNSRCRVCTACSKARRAEPPT